MKVRQASSPILITGGSGMIGANLVRRLLSEGLEVVVLSRQASGGRRLSMLGKHLRIVTVDLTNPSTVAEAVRGVRPLLVFHLASTPFSPPSIPVERHIQVNVLGLLNLLRALERDPPERILAAGSGAEYGEGVALKETDALRPGNWLGASKAAASLLLHAWARQHRVPAMVLRLFTPYGPWESPRRLIPHVILSAIRGDDIRMSDGSQQRDYVFMDDVVEAFWLAAQCDLGTISVVNVGSGVGTPVREVVVRILRKMGHPVKVHFGALPTRSDEIRVMSADVRLAREKLGWTPKTPLDLGIEQTIRWFRERQEEAIEFA